MHVSIPGPLTQRRFRAIWIASVFSNVGGFFQGVAASWLMLELTGSPVWVSAMAASTTLPLLFLALPSGALADLANRRNVLVATQTTMLAAVVGMALLELFDMITPQLLLAFGLVLGIGVAFNAPVWMAIVPDLVPRQMVTSAVALNSASFNGARAVGPALGGLIVVTAGPGVAFAINAVTYVAVLAVVLSFPASDWSPEEDASLVSAIALGLRYVRFTPSLRWLLGVAAGFALTSASVQVLLPNLTRDALDGGAGLYGVLLGAMGVGALAGAASRGRFGGRAGRQTVPLGMALFGALGIGVGLSRLPWLTGLLMAGAGVCWVWALATLNATIQMLSHRWVRGRALGLYTLAFSGVWPIGSLLAGSLADGVGVAWAIVALSAGAVLVGSAALFMPIVGIADVEAPETAEHWDLMPHGDLAMEGGPVMVMNSWTIDEERLDDFLEVMAQLRLVRLRTGASRWRMYRDFEDPRRMVEAWNVPSWEEHLRQHQRIDAAAVVIIRRARTFDTGHGPISRHLVALEIADRAHRPHWEQLVAHHRDAHETDGSIPLVELEEIP